METNPLHPTVIPLLCPVTQHSWGSPGSSSLAARLYTMNNHTYLSPKQAYSEFIISSHSPNDALIATSPTDTLRSHIQTQVIEVDPAIVQFYSRLHEDGVPYVVSIASAVTPTGIRVHPDHSTLNDPSINNNNNGSTPATTQSPFERPLPKPIMIVALQTTHLLVGFRSAKHIVAQLSRVPEFADAIGRTQTDHFVHIVKSATPTERHLRNVVAPLLNGDNAQFVVECLKRAVNRLTKMPADVVNDDDRLLIALSNIFPNDPMCFAAYLFQRVEMKEGDAIYIPPTQPYCILNGVYVETSTKSDAVFYAGLVDRDEISSSQFLQTVSFDDSAPELSRGDKLGDYGTCYLPPVADFQLLDYKIPSGESQQLVPTLAPTVLAVLNGEGHLTVENEEVILPIHVGCVYYLNPQTVFSVVGREDSESLHFIHVGVNESAAPIDSKTSSCSVM